MEDTKNENYFEVFTLFEYSKLIKCFNTEFNSRNYMMNVPKKANDAIHLSHLEGIWKKYKLNTKYMHS